MFENSGKVAQSNICNATKDKIAAFKPKVFAIVALRNPGMKRRHWEQLGEKASHALSRRKHDLVRMHISITPMHGMHSPMACSTHCRFIAYRMHEFLLPAPCHWASQQLGHSLMPNEDYTLEDLLKLDLEPHRDHIEKVGILTVYVAISWTAARPGTGTHVPSR